MLWESEREDEEVVDAEDEKQESICQRGGSADHTAFPEEHEPEGASWHNGER